MSKAPPSKQEVLQAIRLVAQSLGCPPSRSEFKSNSGITEYQLLAHFPSWSEAVRAAGLVPDTQRIKLDDAVLLEDWGQLVRKHRHIPTRQQYRQEGNYSPGVFEKHFGPWSAVPGKFRDFALNKTEWGDVLALLPQVTLASVQSEAYEKIEKAPATGLVEKRHHKLDDRPTYGNPIDFRGLRHEPVNEQGVVFLFGMVAKELGYMVEAVQTGYPDCEAKRQVASGKWQRVRIEFEFESRNFDHPPAGCDVIICWRHNWPGCPTHLEVVELSRVIQSLAKTED